MKDRFTIYDAQYEINKNAVLCIVDDFDLNGKHYVVQHIHICIAFDNDLPETIFSLIFNSDEDIQIKAPKGKFKKYKIDYDNCSQAYPFSDVYGIDEKQLYKTILEYIQMFK